MVLPNRWSQERHFGLVQHNSTSGGGHEEVEGTFINRSTRHKSKVKLGMLFEVALQSPPVILEMGNVV